MSLTALPAAIGQQILDAAARAFGVAGQVLGEGNDSG